MNTRLILPAIAACAIVSSASASSIASFDIGQGSASNLAPGFALVSNLGPTTQNGVTLDINRISGSGVGVRTRGGIPSLVARDFFFNNGVLEFVFSGLDANRSYEFLTYAFDNTGGGSENAKWYVDAVAPENFQYEWLNNADSVNPFTLVTTTNGAGEARIYVDGEGGNNRVNGFQVIPEPTSLVAGLLGLGAIAARRRRR